MEIEFAAYRPGLAIQLFDCGVEYLNQWLVRYAGQNERRSTARTYLALNAVTGEFLGFYTILATQLALVTISEGSARTMPALLIANLAVSRSNQGLGLGSKLLVHALETGLSAAILVGIGVFTVEAKNADLMNFYSKFGFEPLAEGSTRMILKTSKARKLIIEL